MLVGGTIAAPFDGENAHEAVITGLYLAGLVLFLAVPVAVVLGLAATLVLAVWQAMRRRRTAT